jgi:hypothetical protein
VKTRRVVAVVLVVFAAILAPLALTGYWLHERILSTDGYVDTVAPLADNPEITDAVATRVVDSLFERARVEERISGALPGPIDALGNRITDSLRNLATSQTERVLESDAFQRLWEQVNRLAHEQVVAMFTGEGDTVSIDEDRIVLDLGVVADKVRQELVDRGVGILDRVRVPDDTATITLFQSDDVPRFQSLFRVLNDLSVALPIAFVVVVGAAVAVSVRRRRTLVQLGLAVAGAMALLLILIHLFENEYVAQVNERDLDEPAARAVFETLVSALRDWSWFVLVAGVVVAVVAFAADPRKLEWVRRRVRGRASATSEPAALEH